MPTLKCALLLNSCLVYSSCYVTITTFFSSFTVIFVTCLKQTPLGFYHKSPCSSSSPHHFPSIVCVLSVDISAEYNWTHTAPGLCNWFLSLLRPIHIIARIITSFLFITKHHMIFCLSIHQWILDI